MNEQRDQPNDKRDPLAASDQLICYCFQVTEKQIVEAILGQQMKTIEEINRATQAGCGCHTCWPDLEQLLKKFGA